MDPKVAKWLTIMGFPSPDLKYMKMKILSSQWRRMSLFKHPDKPSGTEEAFKELNNAFENLGKIIEQSPPEDLTDEEEIKARKAFKDVNFTKENISSITIVIETNMVKYWEAVLTEKLSVPIDRTNGEKNNGRQWVDEAYKEETEEKTAKVFVTVWHKEKKEHSTMLIQAEDSFQFLNVSYVINVVPKIYEEALDHFERENPTVSKKKTSKKKALPSSKVTRSTRKLGTTFPCKVCDFTAKNVSQLNDHRLSVHIQKAVSSKDKKPKVTPYKPPAPSTPQIIEIPSDITKPIQCYVCRKGFDNYGDLSHHEKEHHELPCTFCD
jgi:hypothetical protein